MVIASYADIIWARHPIFLPHERLLKHMVCIFAWIKCGDMLAFDGRNRKFLANKTAFCLACNPLGTEEEEVDLPYRNRFLKGEFYGTAHVCIIYSPVLAFWYTIVSKSPA